MPHSTYLGGGEWTEIDKSYHKVRDTYPNRSTKSYYDFSRVLNIDACGQALSTLALTSPLIPLP